MVARHRRDENDHTGRGPVNESEEPSGRVGVRRAQRRRTIRGRLARVLALPLAAVVALLAIVVARDVDAYRTAAATARAVSLTLAVQNLTLELQHERGLANNVLGGDVSFRGELPRARAAVDTELTKAFDLATGFSSGAGGGSGLSVGAARATETALSGLADLATVRSRIDDGRVTREAAFDYFTDRVAALSSIDFGLDQSADPELRRGASALAALAEAEEMTAQERAFLGGVFAAGGFGPSEYQQFATINARQQAAVGRFYRYAEPAHRKLVAEALDTGAAREAAFFEKRALGAVDQPFVVSPQSWWSAHTTVIDDLAEAQQAVGQAISDRAGQLRRDTTLRLAGLGGLALVAMAGAVLVVLAAARSITRPLAALAAEARAMATQRLPDAVARMQSPKTALSELDGLNSVSQAQSLAPLASVAVPPRSSAEIVAVAQALDRAQATAYSLAVEQALLRRSTSESLANLGRRNQNLLRRQLGFISQLERDEIDPAGLANLFELDHLATRMRRNAESLLVLVGESSPRTWSQPLPVSDVLRAAVSEVEDYRRVTLRRVDEAFVGGAFVAGIAHMLAELIENGLAFSPPDTDVEIQGRVIAGQYLIGITDHGVGMEEVDLDRANRRLAGQDNFLVAPTRYLGHYVVGHLARQMNIDVTLGRSPVTGVTARVTLPTTVLAVTRGVASPVLSSRNGPVRPTTRAIAIAAVSGSGSGRDLVDAVELPAAATRPPPGAFDEPDENEVTTRMADAPVSDVEVVAQVAHGGGERTRNGLLKRVPRGRITSTSAPWKTITPVDDGGRRNTERPADAISDEKAPPEAAAAAARSRLNSLRAGYARAEAGRDETADDVMKGSSRGR